MTSSDTITSKGKVTSRIWDPVVRIGHWTLVFTSITAYVTEGEAPVHMWAGYLLATVVLFRLLWGFIGSPHARFSDFLYSPARILAYLNIRTPFAAALMLTPQPTGTAVAKLSITLEAARGEESRCATPELEVLRCGNPAARVLPMLSHIARKDAQKLILGWGGNDVHIEVQG